MGPSPKPDSNPRLVVPINRESPPQFLHSTSAKFKTQNARSIQLLSKKDQKLRSFRKIGVNHLQIRSKEHLKFFT